MRRPGNGPLTVIEPISVYKNHTFQFVNGHLSVRYSNDLIVKQIHSSQFRSNIVSGMKI